MAQLITRAARAAAFLPSRIGLAARGVCSTVPLRQDLLFTPGPLLTSPRVKSPMARDVGSRDAELIEAVKTIRESTIALANGGDQYDCVIVQGAGTMGLESVLASWFGGPGQPGPPRRPLVCINGAYGRRAAEILKRYRGVPEIVLLEFSQDLPVDPEQVAAVLQADSNITDVYTIHSETTTGMINDVAAIGNAVELARANGSREISYIIDAMSSFGCYDVDLQALGVDFLITSANKNLQGVPGFALVLGKKTSIDDCQGKSMSLALDLYDQLEGLKGNGQFRFTPPTHSLLAMVEALAELDAEGGIEARRARYMENLNVLSAGMEKFGFKGLLPKDHQGCIISTFITPKDPNWNFNHFYNYLSEHGCVIYPGKLTEVDSFRIGTIGYLYPSDFEHLLGVIHDALQQMGVTDCSPVDWTPSTDPAVCSVVCT